eukprot:146170-Chlamydomonas_euryale.AAC.3
MQGVGRGGCGVRESEEAAILCRRLDYLPNTTSAHASCGQGGERGQAKESAGCGKAGQLPVFASVGNSLSNTTCVCVRTRHARGAGARGAWEEQ